MHCHPAHLTQHEVDTDDLPKASSAGVSHSIIPTKQSRLCSMLTASRKLWISKVDESLERPRYVLLL